MGLVPDVLVVAGRGPRDYYVVRGGGGIVDAHGDAVMTLQVAVFQPIGAGDQGQHLAVVPVPVRRQMRSAVPVNRRHHRDVRRGEIGCDLLWIHRVPSWQPQWAWYMECSRFATIRPATLASSLYIEGCGTPSAWPKRAGPLRCCRRA